MKGRLSQGFLVAAAILAALLAMLYMVALRRPANVRQLPVWRAESERTLAAVQARVARPARLAGAPPESGQPSLADLRWRLTAEDSAILDRGPLSTDWFHPQEANNLNLEVEDSGDLPLARGFANSTTFSSSLAALAAGYPEETHVPAAAGSPEFFAFLDAAERLEPVPFLPWIVARAYAEGKPEKAEMLLGDWAEAQAAESRDFKALMIFLTDLEAQGLLREQALPRVAAAIEASVLSQEECEAAFRAEIFRWAEGSKRVEAGFWTPIYRSSIDRRAAWYIDRQGAMPRVLPLEILPSGLRTVANRSWHPLHFSEYHPLVAALVPQIPTLRQDLNAEVWEAQFQLACLYFHLGQGRWPRTAAELTTAGLPPDFVGMTGRDWFVIELKDFEFPALTQPPDAPTRLALEYLHATGRHARHTGELREWAAENGRGDTAPPPFQRLPDGPVFLWLREHTPVLLRPDGTPIDPTAKPSPADEAAIRACAAAPPRDAHGRYWLRFNRDRWRQAMMALGHGS